MEVAVAAWAIGQVVTTLAVLILSIMGALEKGDGRYAVAMFFLWPLVLPAMLVREIWRKW